MGLHVDTLHRCDLHKMKRSSECLLMKLLALWENNTLHGCSLYSVIFD